MAAGWPRALVARRKTSLARLARRACSAAGSSADVRVWNSLTGKAESLPRADAVTPHVLKWYACGPTVYDRAHLGHARAYVSQDILRRILEKRFQHHVFLVMGVTDVDDKIIQRASERGVPFEQLAREEEREFFRDMDALHVLPPNAVTRVSEHMDDIIDYVANIQRNGFAYEATDESGVYFDTKQLGASYGKLDPAKTKDREAPRNAVSDNDGSDIGSKRDKRDFALWKSTKGALNEPSWESPWGKGRPGWHIECSAMIHRVLGRRLDVHSGGIDLKFPHHNNEIAQCDAYNCSHFRDGQEWCRHFIHFGHLYIRGLKMSKSLKNFVSIKEFLAQSGRDGPDQFRLFCLQYKYRANIHYSEDRVRDAVVLIDRFRNFLRSLDVYGTQAPERRTSSKRCGPEDLEMLDMLFSSRVAFDEALRDDFDTPLALSRVVDLIRRANEYLIQRGSTAPSEILWNIASFVLDVLDVFGLEGLLHDFAYLRDALRISSVASEELSPTFPSSSVSALASELQPHTLLSSLVEFRAAVREQALLDPSSPSNAAILKMCDDLRDHHMPKIGVQLEDLSPGRSFFKLLTTEERDAALKVASEASRSKKSTQEALLAKQKEFETLMSIAPDQLFRLHSEYVGKFSHFDDQGIPTHDAATMEPLTKSQRKKLLKKLEKHTKSYMKYWQVRKDQ